MSVLEEAEKYTRFDGSSKHANSSFQLILDLIKELEQHKAITEAAKFLVSVKRHKDVKGKGAVYLASWPIALRKIEEAVDNLGEDNE